MEKNDKFSILLVVSNDIVQKGIKAKNLINEIASFFNSKGGGRDDRAQAGGKGVKKIPEIMNKSKDLLLNLKF